MPGEQMRKPSQQERDGDTLVDEMPEVVPADLSDTDDLLSDIDALIAETADMLEASAAMDRGRDLGRLLDEIDPVLEVNPVEFVAKYQQRGGQ